MFYYDILKEFHDRSVRYLIVGGLSVNLHGIPRVTQDIDIVIAMDKSNVELVVSIIGEFGYLPRLPVNLMELTDHTKRESWIREKNLKAFTFYHPQDHFKVIDILLVYPLDFDKAFNERTVKSIKDFSINLVSIDNLITMKEFSGRSQDLSDIAMLKKLKKFMENSHEK